MQLEEFVGQTIQEAWIRKNQKDVMYWKVDDAWFRLTAESDCCSNSWFAHCDGSDALVGGMLHKYENFSAGNFYDETDENGEFHEALQIDMMKFEASKGYCTIEFRNSSNGYYSGWCEVSEVENFTPSADYEKLGDF